MPSAAGLNHRASIQSGGGANIPDAEQQKEFARQVMKELGIAPNDIGALQRIEWSRLMATGNAVMDKMNPPARGLSGPGSPPPIAPRAGWSPSLDGRLITGRAFYDVAPEVSKNVPVLIGSVREEGMRYLSNPTEPEWHDSLAKAIGDAKATAVIAAMKKAHPEKAIRTLSYGVNGLSARNNVQRMAKLKHGQGGAPAYQYYFTWQSPMLDGVAGAWHTAELAFCFDNTKRCEQGTGNTPEAQALAKKMATAWANFARTGNPSQEGLTWMPADPDRGQTMVFDNQCRMVDDPEGDLRKILMS
jgi:para-nitrobenzyl esterase